jgi:CDP-glycerol glycerophosphotransferase (TagB/SpsB family)
MHMKKEGGPLEDVKEAVRYFTLQQSLVLLPLRMFLMSLQVVSAYLVSLVMPSRENDTLAVGFSDIFFNGNTRAVFEYMLRHPDRYDVFWCAKNMQAYRDVKKAGGRVFFLHGLAGIPYFLRADVWVLSHAGRGNIPFVPHGDYKKVQLWHGVGYKGHKRERSRAYYMEYDAWCTSSAWTRQRHMHLWDAPPERLYKTGYARLDRLQRFLQMDRRHVLEELGLPRDATVVLYAPTYGGGIWPWKDAYCGFERLCTFCHDRGLHLVTRFHCYTHGSIDRRRLNRILDMYPNVAMLDMAREPDTEKLLAVADILVTDWSSIASDYLVTGRPIVYIDAGRERIVNDAAGEGLVPPHARPGEIACSENDVFIRLTACLNGNRFQRQQRKVLRMLHGQVDGMASRRVAHVVDSIAGAVPTDMAALCAECEEDPDIDMEECLIA